MFLIFFYIYFLNFGQLTNDSLRQKHIKIMFIGDLMNHGPQIKAAYVDSLKTYDYSENFYHLKNIFSSADLIIGNLETILGIKPYSGYPNFSAPTEFAEAIKNSGIKYLVTSNNHSCDKGKKGIIKTLNILDSLQIKHTGTYRNQIERNFLTPLIINKNNFKFALLNYTYDTNGLPIPYPTKVNIIDTTLIKNDLLKTRNLNPDFTIVFLHWGEQYQNRASKKQKKLAYFLYKNGVDLIIGSHPHVIQPIDIKKNKSGIIKNVVVYSLGNFISNQRRFPRDGSMIVSIDLIKNDKKTTITNVKTIPIWVYKYYENKKNHYKILPIYDFIFNPDFLKKNTDFQKMMKYYKHYQSFMLESAK